MKKIIISILFIFLLSLPCLANTGDIIWQDCGANCDQLDWPGEWAGVWVITVESSGCVSGDCVKLHGLDDYDENGDYGATNMYKPVTFDTGLTELTIEYYTKFNPSLDLMIYNTKSIRLHRTNANGDYPYALIEPWFDQNHYTSSWDVATLIPTDVVTSVVENEGSYCPPNGDGTYNCAFGRLAIQYTVNGDDGRGEDIWRKVRFYVKMPTSEQASDGIVKYWVDDVLVYTLSPYKVRETGEPLTINAVRWYPSSEAAVKIYSGGNNGYSWTLTGEGTDEYSLDQSSDLPRVDKVYENGEPGAPIAIPQGTHGSLNAGEWDYSGGVLYVRCTDGVDPDTKSPFSTADSIKIGIDFYQWFDEMTIWEGYVPPNWEATHQAETTRTKWSATGADCKWSSTGATIK